MQSHKDSLLAYMYVYVYANIEYLYIYVSGYVFIIYLDYVLNSHLLWIELCSPKWYTEVLTLEPHNVTLFGSRVRAGIAS